MNKRVFYHACKRLYSIFNRHIALNHEFISKKTIVLDGGKTFLFGQVCNTFIKNVEGTGLKIDIEGNFRKACDEGEAAILNLMDELKDLIMQASLEYRKNLIKQMEITKMASNIGPNSEIWDELPKYRTIADELNRELDECLVLFKTIGQLAYDQTLISLFMVETISDDFGSADKIQKRYKELEVLLLNEVEENKKQEIELLKLKRESILTGVS